MSKNLTFIICLLATIGGYTQSSASVFFKETSGVKFAVEKIQKSLMSQGYTVRLNENIGRSSKTENVNIFLTGVQNKTWIKSITDVAPPSPLGLEAEGFNIQRTKGKDATTIFVVANDQAGLMYGGLELAEILKFNGINFQEKKW